MSIALSETVSVDSIILPVVMEDFHYLVGDASENLKSHLVNIINHGVEGYEDYEKLRLNSDCYVLNTIIEVDGIELLYLVEFEAGYDDGSVNVSVGKRDVTYKHLTLAEVSVKRIEITELDSGDDVALFSWRDIRWISSLASSGERDLANIVVFHVFSDTEVFNSITDEAERKRGYHG